MKNIYCLIFIDRIWIRSILRIEFVPLFFEDRINLMSKPNSTKKSKDQEEGDTKCVALNWNVEQNRFYRK